MGAAKKFLTALGRIDVGVCYTRGASSRRWCGAWERRGRLGAGGGGIEAAARMCNSLIDLDCPVVFSPLRESP